MSEDQREVVVTGVRIGLADLINLVVALFIAFAVAAALFGAIAAGGFFILQQLGWV